MACSPFPSPRELSEMATLLEVVNETFVSADQPKVIGNYLLDKVIGEGRFARVRAGIHMLAQGKVAVKTLCKFSASRGDIQRCLFYQEAASLRRLQHWNIVRLYETMETKNSYYLVLEVIQGMSLSTLLKKRGTLPEHEAQHIIGQLASGVYYMTGKDVVHRDIKPSNLMLRMPELHLQIIDFGLSASCVAGQQLQDRCGTPMYAAPEIFGKQPYNGAVDVWSMGVVLCEMVTGISQFFSDVGNMSSLLKLYTSVSTTTSLPPCITEDCMDILKGMMTINAAHRLTSAQVVQHVWLKDPMTREAQRGESVGHIDSELLHSICRKYKFAYRDVYESVLDNKCNQHSAIYHVSLATRNGEHREGDSRTDSSVFDLARTECRLLNSGNDEKELNVTDDTYTVLN